MGFFEGTADLIHSGVDSAVDLEATYKIGQKCRARIVMLSLASTPKKIYMSLAPHVVTLGQPMVKLEEEEDEDMDGNDVREVKAFLGERWPVGTVFEEVIVRRVDTTVGLFCEIKGIEGVRAHVHVSYFRSNSTILVLFVSTQLT